MINDIAENLKTIKYSVFDRLFFLYVIIVSGAALSAVRTPGALMLLGIWSGAVLMLHGLLLKRSFWTACGCWMVYFIMSTVVLGSFHPYFMMEIIILLLAGYTVVKVWGRDLFRHYSQIIYVLSAISLFFYAIHLSMPGVIHWLIKNFDCQGGLFQMEWRNCGSVIIYTINEALEESMPRNCGFCWEPGPFACFIVIALFFNYVVNGDLSRKRNWILITALITTYSTTGYMMFGFLVLYYILNHNHLLIKICSIVVAMIAVIIYIQVDFLGRKVQDQLEMTELWSMHVEHSRLYGKHYTPGRFVSMKLAMKNFEQRPILGYAGNTKKEYSSQLGASVAIISGIGYILARYGLVGIAFYLVMLGSSGYYFYKLTRNRSHWGGWLWISLNLMISISFKLALSPIFFAFMFSSFFGDGTTVEKLPENPDADAEETPAPEALVGNSLWRERQLPGDRV